MTDSLQQYLTYIAVMNLRSEDQRIEDDLAYMIPMQGFGYLDRIHVIYQEDPQTLQRRYTGIGSFWYPPEESTHE